MLDRRTGLLTGGGMFLVGVLLLVGALAGTLAPASPFAGLARYEWVAFGVLSAVFGAAFAAIVLVLT